MPSECADSFGAISVCAFSMSGLVFDELSEKNIVVARFSNWPERSSAHDGVLEGRRGLVIDDVRNFLALFGHAGFHRGHVVLVLDLVERRPPEGQRALASEGIVGRQGSGGDRVHGHRSERRG